MGIDSVENVVRRLGEKKGQWGRVSETSGVPYDTVTKIAQGKTKNPRINTIERLDRALREMEAAA